MKASRSARCTPASTRWPSRRCPGSGHSCAAATRCATSSRDGRWPRPFPPTGSAAADGNGAVLVALTEGVSALVLRVGRPAASPRPTSTALLEGVFLDLVPVVLDAGADYVAAADAVLALLTALDDDQRSRLSVDLGADPLTAPLSEQARAGRRRRRRHGGETAPATTAACGRSRSTARRFTTWAPARRGSWPAASPRRSPTCGCWRTAASRSPDALQQISFRIAADDDQFMTIAKLRAARQLWARVADVVGAPEAGGGHAARGDVAADDGQARSVGEHAAHHAGRVLGGRRRSGHRAGAPVRRGHSTAASQTSRRASRGASPATRSCCCWRNPTSAACWTRQAGPGSSKTSPNELAGQAWKHFQDIESRGGFEERPRLHRRRDRGRAAGAAPTTSRTGAPR